MNTDTDSVAERPLPTSTSEDAPAATAPDPKPKPEAVASVLLPVPLVQQLVKHMAFAIHSGAFNQLQVAELHAVTGNLLLVDQLATESAGRGNSAH